MGNESFPYSVGYPSYNLKLNQNTRKKPFLLQSALTEWKIHSLLFMISRVFICSEDGKC